MATDGLDENIGSRAADRAASSPEMMGVVADDAKDARDVHALDFDGDADVDALASVETAPRRASRNEGAGSQAFDSRAGWRLRLA